VGNTANGCASTPVSGTHWTRTSPIWTTAATTTETAGLSPVPAPVSTTTINSITSSVAASETSSVAAPETSSVAAPGTSSVAAPGTSSVAAPGTSSVATPVPSPAATGSGSYKEADSWKGRE